MRNGSKVICVDDSRLANKVKKHQVYTVDEVESVVRILSLVGIKGWFATYRFRELTETEEVKIIMKRYVQEG